MKTLMLGWEFPPRISGGLGTACYGLSRALDRLGVQITFVLPRVRAGHDTGSVNLIEPSEMTGRRETGSGSFAHTTFYAVSSSLRPYGSMGPGNSLQASPGSNREIAALGIRREYSEETELYDGDLLAQVHRFAERIIPLASTERFDLVHAHDWMTYPAGIAAARTGGKPLVVHVHSTEFDRNGDHVHPKVYELERQGLQEASRVIAVSRMTKTQVCRRYRIAPEKVEVVYNGVDLPATLWQRRARRGRTADKVVLYLGRITMQKGPEYFLEAAHRVLSVMPGVRFVMAGDGDMRQQAFELAERLGIAAKVSFPGFLRGEEVWKAYAQADLFVMPSVSEPFGIVALEAMQSRVPILISKQSGVAELLSNALKVDFWDIQEMANKMTAVLRYRTLHRALRNGGAAEAARFRWEFAAAQIKEVYERLLAG